METTLKTSKTNKKISEKLAKYNYHP